MTDMILDLPVRPLRACEKAELGALEVLVCLSRAMSPRDKQSRIALDERHRFDRRVHAQRLQRRRHDAEPEPTGSS